MPPAWGWWRSLARILGSAELERVLGGAREELTLVVEDLHWADQFTRDLLGFLVRNLRAGVALVLTCRLDELRPGHPLRPFLAELNRGGRAERLELGRLGRGELAELVAGILAEPPSPGLSREILARSEGNPFFAEELLAARRAGTRLPTALRDLLLARVDALPEPAQRVLAAAAAGYALVQEAVYGELLPAQRGPLHAAYARALDRRIQLRDASAGTSAGVPRSSWPSSPITGTPPATRDRHCLRSCGPACCWIGSATTTGAPRTVPRRWPRSSGRWPRFPPTRRRGSGRAC